MIRRENGEKVIRRKWQKKKAQKKQRAKFTKIGSWADGQESDSYVVTQYTYGQYSQSDSIQFHYVKGQGQRCKGQAEQPQSIGLQIRWVGYFLQECNASRVTTASLWWGSRRKCTYVFSKAVTLLSLFLSLHRFINLFSLSRGHRKIKLCELR